MRQYCRKTMHANCHNLTEAYVTMQSIVLQLLHCSESGPDILKVDEEGDDKRKKMKTNEKYRSFHLFVILCVLDLALGSPCPACLLPHLQCPSERANTSSACILFCLKSVWDCNPTNSAQGSAFSLYNIWNIELKLNIYQCRCYQDAIKKLRVKSKTLTHSPIVWKTPVSFPSKLDTLLGISETHSS